METLSICRTASFSKLVPNGYQAQVFPDPPEIEGLTKEVRLEELEGSEQCNQRDMSSKEESGWNKKKTKVNKIWNFVSHRKGASSQRNRPQSMILLGDISRPSEVKSKVTFMDRMKSFRRSKTSTGASKNIPVRSGKVQEPQEAVGIYHIRKIEEALKPFRHSYAGHIEGLEPFLEDVQGLVQAPKRGNRKLLASDDFGIQVEKDSWEEEEAPGHVNSDRQPRSYLKNMSPRSHEAPSVWVEDTRIQGLETTIEGPTLEGDTEGSYEESPGQQHRDKMAPFSVVVKFFNNMAEVARKWRSLSREEPQLGRRHREPYCSDGFILKGTTSQVSFPLDLPCQTTEANLWGNAMGRCQRHHQKAPHTSCTFEMSIEDKEIAGQALSGPCNAATSSMTSAVFKFQDDPVRQKGHCHSNCHTFTREHSSSEELDEDTETVVSFLKEDNSSREPPELGAYAKRFTTEAVMENLEDKPSEMKEQEGSVGPEESSQARKPQKLEMEMGAGDAEGKAPKVCSGVCHSQVRLAFPNNYLKLLGPQKPAKLSYLTPQTPLSARNILKGMLLVIRCRELG